MHAAKCAPPKRCVNACQTAFRKRFAAGESTAQQGLQEMKTAKPASPEWQATYAKGHAEIDHCLADNRKLQGKER
jgi:hypothetical protein